MATTEQTQPTPQPIAEKTEKKVRVSPMAQIFKRLDEIEKQVKEGQKPTPQNQSPSSSVSSSFKSLSEAQAVPLQPTEAHNHEHENCPTCGKATSKHYVKPYDKFCSDCGEPNPAFKDETQCPNCTTHLGAIENLKNLNACPTCGFKGKVNKL